MWFKNISLFQCEEDLALSEEALNEKLKTQAITPCGKTQISTTGWGNPFGRSEEYYLHAHNGCYLLAMVKEQRLLPSSVIRDAVIEKIKKIQMEEDRVLSTAERTSLRDDVIFDLLPKAFTKKTTTYGYLDTRHRWLIIDSNSATTAEAFYTLLRDTLGRLRAHLPQTAKKPSQLLTHWLLEHDAPSPFTIEDSCELRDMKNGIGSIKFQKQDLFKPEVAKHIRDGHAVAELALNFENKLSFTLQQDLRIKHIKLLDILTAQRKEASAENEDELLDTDFVMMTHTLTELLTHLFRIAGESSLGAIEATQSEALTTE